MQILAVVPLRLTRQGLVRTVVVAAVAVAVDTVAVAVAVTAGNLEH